MSSANKAPKVAKTKSTPSSNGPRKVQKRTIAHSSSYVPSTPASSKPTGPPMSQTQVKRTFQNDEVSASAPISKPRATTPSSSAASSTSSYQASLATPKQQPSTPPFSARAHPIRPNSPVQPISAATLNSARPIQPAYSTTTSRAAYSPYQQPTTSSTTIPSFDFFGQSTASAFSGIHITPLKSSKPSSSAQSPHRVQQQSLKHQAISTFEHRFNNPMPLTSPTTVSLQTPPGTHSFNSSQTQRTNASKQSTTQKKKTSAAVLTPHTQRSFGTHLRQVRDDHDNSMDTIDKQTISNVHNPETSFNIAPNTGKHNKMTKMVDEVDTDGQLNAEALVFNDISSTDDSNFHTNHALGSL